MYSTITDRRVVAEKCFLCVYMRVCILMRFEGGWKSARICMQPSKQGRRGRPRGVQFREGGAGAREECSQGGLLLFVDFENPRTASQIEEW